MVITLTPLLCPAPIDVAIIPIRVISSRRGSITVPAISPLRAIKRGVRRNPHHALPRNPANCEISTIEL
jgi:hypothetical protein